LGLQRYGNEWNNEKIPSNSSKKGKIKGELAVLLYNILKINVLILISSPFLGTEDDQYLP
jgi:hypothetical protein